MNRQVDRALSGGEKSGDVMKYFAEMDDILESNSGVNDNKTLTSDASDPPCPIDNNTYTKLKLTDDAIHITNIDKSHLTAEIELHIAPNDKFWTSILEQEENLEEDMPETSSAEDIAAENELRKNAAIARSYRNRITKWFIGFKASIHAFDAYRIYSYNKKTNCEQTEAIYENAVVRMLKPQEELDEKPRIYTLWKHAVKGDECVCGTYFTLEDVMKENGRQFKVRFEISVPVDEFLPLSGFTMYPNKVFENLSLELKLGIQQNLVICQVDPLKEFENQLKMLIGGSNDALAALYIHLQSDLGTYTRRFTQAGDTFVSNIYTISKNGVVTNNSVATLFAVTKGRLNRLQSHLNGFNVKDSVLQALREKYRNKPLIVPAQFCDYQAFSQTPSGSALKCNTTYGMTNVSSLIFIFPRTHNEITCCCNPHFSSIQLQIDNKPYPDKPFTTHEASHTMFNITNAGLDSLFSPSEEFSYSLNFKELQGVEEIKYKKIATGGKLETTETTLQKEWMVVEPYKDNTSYCFVCSTERLSGYGTFCDGLTKDNAHITLTGALMGNPSHNPYYTHPLSHHPAVQTDFPKNDRSPVMIVVQDCFWVLRTDRTAEFVSNDKYFYDEAVQTQDQ